MKLVQLQWCGNRFVRQVLRKARLSECKFTRSDYNLPNRSMLNPFRARASCFKAVRSLARCLTLLLSVRRAARTSQEADSSCSIGPVTDSARPDCAFAKPILDNLRGLSARPLTRYMQHTAVPRRLVARLKQRSRKACKGGKAS